MVPLTAVLCCAECPGQNNAPKMSPPGPGTCQCDLIQHKGLCRRDYVKDVGGGVALDYPVGPKSVSLRGPSEREWKRLSQRAGRLSQCLVLMPGAGLGIVLVFSQARARCCPGFGFTLLCGQVDKDDLNASHYVTLHSSGPILTL